MAVPPTLLAALASLHRAQARCSFSGQTQNRMQVTGLGHDMCPTDHIPWILFWNLSMTRTSRTG
eukprot:6043196-Amphidinium_carterae.1